MRNSKKPANTSAKKPANKKPAVKSAAPAKAETSAPRKLARDAANIHAQRTHFGKITPRDNTYLRCLSEAGATEKTSVTLAQIVAKHGERNPHYTGSAKLTDVGAFVRLIKAGRVTETNGQFRFTGEKAATEARGLASRKFTA